MKKLKEKLRESLAMTLIELLISSILIGIVTLGAISIEYVVRRSQKSASDSSQVATRTMAAMKQITSDATAAVGDALNQGITYDSDTSVLGINICFRHDNESNPTPDTYTDDSWVCYSQGSSAGSHKLTEIYRCEIPATSPPDPPAEALLENEFCYSAPTERLIIENDALGFFTVKKTADSEIKHIDFTLGSCADLSKDENPITNPCYSLETRISPAGISY